MNNLNSHCVYLTLIKTPSSKRQWKLISHMSAKLLTKASSSCLASGAPPLHWSSSAEGDGRRREDSSNEDDEEDGNCRMSGDPAEDNDGVGEIDKRDTPEVSAVNDR